MGWKGRHVLTKAMKKPRLLELLATVLYIGTVGYGGPAILSWMKKRMVQEKKWISEEEFMGSLSLAQILPGAVSVTLMGYIGQRLNTRWGGILLPLALVLPSFIVITILTHIYFVFGNITFIREVFQGLGALVVALLVNATIYLGGGVFKKENPVSFRGIIVAVPAFAAAFFLHLNIILSILVSGLLGFLLFYSDQKTKNVKKSEPQGPDRAEAMGSILDRLLAPFISIAVLTVIFILFTGSWDIFKTFFKIGMFAFGGGFTSIPIIQHEVVDKLYWVTLTAFRDGIALGQITPGPVLITSAFIGYKLQGIIGAVVAAAGIFSPSLAAMLALGGMHAKIRDQRVITAVIKGFLSGFIGLLIAVTLQFGIHSLVNWQSWIIFGLSLLYLMLWKKEPVWLILGTIGISLLIFRI
jgi:chromate transporter